MFSKALVCCLVAYVASQAVVENYPPQPYHFSYDNTDEFGTRMTREETSDANNAKVGSYSYTDAAGVTRTVKYVADENGFRATVETNEHGTKSGVTGDAEYFSSAPEYVAPVGPAPAKPVVVHAVQQAPLVHAVHQAPVVHAVQHAPLVHAVQHAPVVQAVQHAPVLHAVHAVQATPVVHGTPLVHAVHSTPVLHAVHDGGGQVYHAVQTGGGGPVYHAVHTGGGNVALHAAPVSYATAQHPVGVAHAPLTYTLGKAKSR